MKTANAIILDDEPYAIKRLEQLLGQFDTVECIGTFQKAQPAEDFVLREDIDLIFLDIEMPEKSGLELADTFLQISPQSTIVFTTSHDHYAVKAIRKGAFDYLTKPIDIDELKDCIHRYVNETQLNLSEREIEVIRLLAKGLKSQEIAERLFLSRHTVDTHRRRILQKTGSKNTADLIQFAIKCNLV